MKRNLWTLLLLSLALNVMSVSAQNQSLDVAGKPRLSINSGSGSTIGESQ